MNYPMTDIEAREALVGEIYLFKKIYGYSAYELAVKHGFSGSEEDWLLSLTAYGLAVRNGFEGTLEEWISSLKGEKGETGTMELHGDLDALGERIKNVAAPVDDYDAVNKKHVHDTFVKKIDQLDANGETVVNVAAPMNDTDAVNKKYVHDTFVKKVDQLDANDGTVVNVAAPVNDTDAVNKKYAHDTFLESAVTDISEEFITKTYLGISLTKKHVYKQGNTVYGSISFTVPDNVLTDQYQMAIDIANKYKPKYDIVCPIMVMTTAGDSVIAYLSTGKVAYIEPVAGYIFLPEYSDNAGFTNEFTISFAYLCV